MRTTIPTTLALVLAACIPDGPTQGDGADESETSGDGDGDPTGDPTGDGDGDGDGDSECSCPGGQSFDECGVQAPLLLESTISWPPDIDEWQVDEICTVANVSIGTTVELECPSGSITITLITELPWLPGFAAGEQLHLRANENVGPSWRDTWPYLRWRLDRADDSELLASYASTKQLDKQINFIADPFATQIVTGLCEPSCSDELRREDVGVRFTSGDQQLLLFAGQIDGLGEHRFVVAEATAHSCLRDVELGLGSYRLFIAHTVASPDACTLVLGHS